MKKSISLCVVLLVMLLGTIVLADDPINFLGKVTGQTGQTTYKTYDMIRFQPLEKGGLIPNDSEIRVGNNSELTLILAPAVAFSPECVARITLGSNSTVLAHMFFHYFAQWPEDDQIWWELMENWRGNEFAFEFDLSRGSMRVELNQSFMELAKFVGRLDDYKLIPSYDEANVVFEVAIVENAVYGKDFELSDMPSMAVLFQLKLAEMNVASFNNLTPAQKKEYDEFVNTYKTVMSFLPVTVYEITVTKGVLQISDGAIHNQLIRAGETVKIAISN